MHAKPTQLPIIVPNSDCEFELFEPELVIDIGSADEEELGVESNNGDG